MFTLAEPVPGTSQPSRSSSLRLQDSSACGGATALRPSSARTAMRCAATGATPSCWKAKARASIASSATVTRACWRMCSAHEGTTKSSKGVKSGKSQKRHQEPKRVKERTPRWHPGSHGRTSPQTSHSVVSCARCAAGVSVTGSRDTQRNCKKLTTEESQALYPGLI